MAKKKNKIEVGLIDGNSVSETTLPDVNLYKEKVRRGKVRQVSTKPAMIISRLDYPEFIKIGDEEVRVSPRGKVKIADRTKLVEPLPKGLILKVINKKK